MIKKGRSIGISHVNDQQVENALNKTYKPNTLDAIQLGGVDLMDMREVGTGLRGVSSIHVHETGSISEETVASFPDYVQRGLPKGKLTTISGRTGQGKSLYPFLRFTTAEELSPTLSNHFKSMTIGYTIYIATQTKNKEKNKNHHHPNSLYMETLPSHKSIWDQIEDLYKTSYIGEWV